MQLKYNKPACHYIFKHKTKGNATPKFYLCNYLYTLEIQKSCFSEN